MEIDLSKPGASEERSKLTRFHVVLNDATLVPEQCYRRNSVHYPLVCYVNCIAGLIQSKNYEVVPLFVSHALKFMDERPPTPAAAAYYSMLQRYLRQVSHVLKNFTAVSEESMTRWIPAEVLDAGSQVVPNKTMEPMR